MNDDQIILGIESAIGGGSICLTSNGREIGAWVGNQDISKAEELLPNVDRILRESSLSLASLHGIIVSTGPGSFTGIKIGIATVLGLRAALRLRCLGISALSALSLSVDESSIVALPVGRKTICVQSFKRGLFTSEPQSIDENGLEAYAVHGSKLILHGSLFDLEKFPNAVNAGWNIASYLCSAADSDFTSTDLRPLFLETKSSNI